MSSPSDSESGESDSKWGKLGFARQIGFSAAHSRAKLVMGTLPTLSPQNLGCSSGVALVSQTKPPVKSFATFKLLETTPLPQNVGCSSGVALVSLTKAPVKSSVSESGKNHRPDKPTEASKCKVDPLDVFVRGQPKLAGLDSDSESWESDSNWKLSLSKHQARRAHERRREPPKMVGLEFFGWSTSDEEPKLKAPVKSSVSESGKNHRPDKPTEASKCKVDPLDVFVRGQPKLAGLGHFELDSDSESWESDSNWKLSLSKHQARRAHKRRREPPKMVGLEFFGWLTDEEEPKLNNRNRDHSMNCQLFKNYSAGDDDGNLLGMKVMVCDDVCDLKRRLSLLEQSNQILRGVIEEAEGKIVKVQNKSVDINELQGVINILADTKKLRIIL